MSAAARLPHMTPERHCMHIEFVFVAPSPPLAPQQPPSDAPRLAAATRPAPAAASGARLSRWRALRPRIAEADESVVWVEGQRPPLPPDPPPPPDPALASSPPPRLLPWEGDLRGATWNAQSFFCVCPNRQRRKHALVTRLFQHVDVVMLQEVHGSAGAFAAYRPPPGVTAYWAAGTQSRAGVGILVHSRLLSQFDPQHTWWQVPIPGRLGILRLRGPKGSLNLQVVYLPTGDAAPLDGAATGAAPPPADTLPDPALSLPRQRCLVIRRIGTLLQADEAASVIAGDWNFVTDPEDRSQRLTGALSPTQDAQEREAWAALLRQHPRLHELHQPLATHKGPLTYGRLDRVYVDWHASFQLDHVVASSVLPWTPGLSQHRPVMFQRTHAPVGSRPPPMTDAQIARPGWAIRVAARFGEMVGSIDAPFLRLRCLKQAIHETAAFDAATSARRRTETDPHAALGLVMRTLRRITLGRPLQAERAVEALPELGPLLDGDALARRPGRTIGLLRDLASRLARDCVTADLEALRAALAQGKLDEEGAGQRRGNILRALRRLVPGKGGSATVIELPDGSCSAQPDLAGAALRTHWGRVFGPSSATVAGLPAWLAQSSPGATSLKQRCAALQVRHLPIRRRDVELAIERTGTSAPGPDGIPYAAWRHLGPLGVDVLWAVARAMETPTGAEQMQAAFPLDADGVSEFNLASMLFLPKKDGRVSPTGDPLYAPAEVRPLSVCNTDNRLVSSAARLRYEPLLERVILRHQRGFLRGRTMLLNILDVDESMRILAASGDDPVAILFDFAAAFPSLSHAYLHGLLDELALPAEMRWFVRGLYSGHGCQLRLGGAVLPGFPIVAGVRQGDPLSPLLFALAIEPLLDALDPLVAPGCVRAYADDIAVVLPSVSTQLAPVMSVFRRFAWHSGLELNVRKCAVINLGDSSHAALQERMAAQCPGWGAATVSGAGKYLGVVLGPDASPLIWQAPCARILQRARLWAAAKLGHLWNTVVWNVYLLPILGFTLQFYPLPPEWSQLEQQLVRLLFPGPGNWIQARDLITIKQDLGFPAALHDARELALAAPFRVLHRDGAREGGVDARRRVIAIADADDGSNHLGRMGRLRQWMRTSIAQHLLGTATTLRARGISLASVEASIRGDMPRPLTRGCARRVERGLQAGASRMLRAQRPPHWLPRLRQRLARWEIQPLPGRRGLRVVAVVRRLTRLRAPPRVLAALLRTWLNAWVTDRRMSICPGRGCRWGCAHGPDSLEHYGACRRLHAAGQLVLRLPPPRPTEHRLGDFLLLSLAGSDLSTQSLVRGAAHAALAYWTLNTLRQCDHGQPPPAEQIYRQHGIQLLGGWSELRRTLPPLPA